MLNRRDPDRCGRPYPFWGGGRVCVDDSATTVRPLDRNHDPKIIVEAGDACRPAALNKVHVLPVIAREDYDNFRNEIGLGARMTYADWSGMLSRQVEIARDSGLTVVMAEIIYDHFREYCRANGRKPDQAMLLAYSRFKKAVDIEYPA